MGSGLTLLLMGEQGRPVCRALLHHGAAARRWDWLRPRPQHVAAKEGGERSKNISPPPLDVVLQKIRRNPISCQISSKNFRILPRNMFSTLVSLYFLPF